ncbi:hypothetical protein [Streptomyces sp. 8N706]|uniref:hypothetical protein n=1 Tax=Streptomyces sp. 8N706 TaxID=3457416 RepID=UPI003FD3ED37
MVQLQKIRRATLAALMVGGLASTGSGLAFADNHGATATGGSGSEDVFQQNTAQDHRQNNNCANTNRTSLPGELTGSRAETRCATGDASFNKRTVTKGGGAHATGGSAEFDAFQQNTAQKGRQNNNCANHNLPFTVGDSAGGQVATHCSDKDRSHNKHTLTKGGGAHTTGGSGAGVLQQNTAQEGRQNNTCTHLNAGGINASDGGRVDSHCANKDRSHNKHTLAKGGGAHTTGGSAVGVFQQNTAQEGRQNNTCTNPNNSNINASDGGRVDSHCANKDRSHNKHTLTKGGGAHTTGGSATDQVFQQNRAQEGRQNNNCANLANSGVGTTGGRVANSCANKDHSHNKHTLTKGGGAHATGGSSGGGTVHQQSTAQEGRQNNNCANPNVSGAGTTGGRVDSHCANKDRSHNKHTLVKSGGAHATGGSAANSSLFQQNAAQEGRQNNNCSNLNVSSISADGGRAEARCATVDHSVSKGTTEINGGAKAVGGSSTAELAQQNTAQEGRQNNNCANPNGVNLTATGSRTRAQCVAVDNSRNIRSGHR